MPGEAEPQPVERRGLLAAAAALLGGLLALIGLPASRLFVAPLDGRQSHEEWFSLGSVDDFGDDRKDVEYVVERQEGWYRGHVVRRVSVGRKDGEWLVLSTTCSHLGCGVTWQPGTRTFFCPCHGGEFHEDGSVRTAPPTRSLVRLEVREQSGQLQVRGA